MFRNFIKLLISLYQKYISPFFVYIFGHSCRFTPTCSEYAREAIHKHGILVGGYMSVLRVVKCNPFSKPGYDPVT